jgi:hypothetical protein
MHDVMSRQLGLIHRTQALEAGMSERQVDLRLCRDEWLAVHPKVYRAADAPVSEGQRRLAAVLACGTGSACSHRTAAIQHGTRAFNGDLVEVSVPGDGRPRLRGVVVHRMRDLTPADIEEVDGIPTTRPARTVVDLGMVLREPMVGLVLEEWLADRRLTVAHLRATIDHLQGRGRWGVGVARRALERRALGDAVPDSTDEHLLAMILAEYGAPAPTYHYLLRHGEEVLAEFDYAYAEASLGLEVVGYHPHTRSRRAFEDLLQRQNRVQAQGWMILSYTPRMLRDRPWLVAREIESHRVARTPR